MARIMGGFASGLPLTVPKRGTRPTSGRVREALFSALEARNVIDDARVLDLYAGAGTLGLEAASRGARDITLVDKSREAADACRTNASTVKKGARATVAPMITVVSQPVQRFLGQAQETIDLAFIDPPYDLKEDDLAKDLIALSALLRAGSVIIVERDSRSPEPSWPETMRLDRQRNYGDTTLWWAVHKPLTPENNKPPTALAKQPT